jgi:hypothetical protein
MEQKTQKPSNRRFWGIAIAVMVLPALIVCALVFPAYTWGGEGALSLGLSTNKDSIGLNDSMTVTLTLKNTGNQKVRVSEDDTSFQISVTDENGNAVRFISMVKMMDYSVAPGYSGGNVMKELAPGAVMTQSFGIHNYSGFDPNNSRDEYRYHGQYPDGFDIQAGHMYKVIGKCSCSNTEGFPTLPHWSGSLKTEERTFTVTK